MLAFTTDIVSTDYFTYGTKELQTWGRNAQQNIKNKPSATALCSSGCLFLMAAEVLNLQ